MTELDSSIRFSVVIPAAGLSRRMGCSKLLLPWGNSTVIQTLVEELQWGGIAQIVIVLRTGDVELQSAISKLEVIPVTPEIDPTDMRQSVELGLERLKSNWSCEGGWLLIPADHPLVSKSTVIQLLENWTPEKRQILIPTFEGQRGHPTLFSWDLAADVGSIPSDHGVNWLVRRDHQMIREIPMQDAGVTADLDTPEDYARFYNEKGATKLT